MGALLLLGLSSTPCLVPCRGMFYLRISLAD